MKRETWKNISFILIVLSAFVTFKIFFGIEEPTLEGKLAILITLVPAIIIQVFLFFKKRVE